MAGHALVFNASGILGWAVVNEILNNYPSKGTYSRVTALTSRPLTWEESLWPKPGDGVPELHIVSGIDLSEGTIIDLKQVLISKIPNIETITHVFYFSYVFQPDFAAETQSNLAMMWRGFGLIESLAPKLSYVILPSGTKGYGVHIPNLPGFEALYKESRVGEILMPLRNDVFYHVLRDGLNRLQQGKSWKWAEIRCDIGNGFVPRPNPYNLPGLLMNFLSLYTFMHQQGHAGAASKQVPFPFPPTSWNSLSNDGGQDIFGRFSIYLANNPTKSGNAEVYNISDEAQSHGFSERWPYICSLFGLEGVAPIDTSNPEYITPVKFIKRYADQVDLLQKEKGVSLQNILTAPGLEVWAGLFDFNHELVIDNAKSIDFKEEMQFQDTWRIMFERYERAKRAYLGR